MEKIVVGVSGRHVHLSQEHLEVLFGEGYELTLFKELSQPGQFACTEQVTIYNKLADKEMKNVRILGPVRPSTQVEISKSDSIKLKLTVPVKESGDLAGTPGITIIGPNGQVDITEGVIIANRHIHLQTKEAEAFGLKDKDIVKVEVSGDKAGVMHNVLIRVNDNFKADFHIDTDDAAAFLLNTGDIVTIIK